MVCRGRFAHSMMAECAAIVAALRWAVRADLEKGSTVVIHSDCLSMVESLSARRAHRCRPGGVMLLRAARSMTARLRRRGMRVEFRHVTRDTVARADALCWDAYSHKPVAGEHITGFLQGRRR